MRYERKNMKTVAIFTLGCKVNQVESEHIKEEFIGRGYQVVGPDESADIYVVNTCTVTHVSDRKSRSVIRRLIRRRPESLVVITGCMAQLGQEALHSLDGIGLIVGNRNKENLVQMVENCLEGTLADRDYDLALPTSHDKLKPVIYSETHERTRAFVKVQDGCQSYCSYCIVPYVRGPVRSKMPDDVVREIRQLVQLGYREIVLTGIHCGLYGLDLEGWDLTRLLRAILEQIPGEYRIRLGSIEPLEVKPELLNLMAAGKQICRHLHIPLQSGSDRVLALMNRRYRRDYYLRLVEEIARLIPEAGIAADVMVGFPAESEEDFAETYELLLGLPILDLHVFKYSARPGTRAYDLGDNVAAQIKRERSERLIELAANKHREFCRRFIGQEFDVLVERKAGDNYYLGFTDNYIEVGFRDDEDRRGQMVRLRLTEVNGDFNNGCFVNK